jgi:hypothetical protein
MPDLLIHLVQGVELRSEFIEFLLLGSVDFF